MKYYSENLKKLFDTAEELENAELEQEKKEEEAKIAAVKLREERAARAKEVEEAFSDANVATNKANSLLKNFIKDYGSFHTTVRTSVPNLLDWFFNS